MVSLVWFISADCLDVISMDWKDEKKSLKPDIFWLNYIMPIWLLGLKPYADLNPRQNTAGRGMEGRHTFVSSCRVFYQSDRISVHKIRHGEVPIFGAWSPLVIMWYKSWRPLFASICIQRADPTSFNSKSTAALTPRVSSTTALAMPPITKCTWSISPTCRVGGGGLYVITPSKLIFWLKFQQTHIPSILQQVHISSNK